MKTSDNKNGGTLAIISGSTSTQLKSAVVSGSSRTNVVHKHNAGLSATGSFTFSFNWTAPPTNVGDIKFYAAGNATDDQGDSLNDYIYLAQQTVVPFTTGLFEAGTITDIQIFPNPAHDYLNIKIPVGNTAEYNFQLLDCNGKMVLNETRKTGITSNSIHIQLPDEIENGYYFLTATDRENKSVVTKVFVYN